MTVFFSVRYVVFGGSVVIDVIVFSSRLVIVIGLAVYVVVTFPATVLVMVRVGGSGARLLMGLRAVKV